MRMTFSYDLSDEHHVCAACDGQAGPSERCPTEKPRDGVIAYVQITCTAATVLVQVRDVAMVRLAQLCVQTVIGWSNPLKWSCHIRDPKE